MSAEFERIQLEPSDTLVSVRARLSHLRGQRVLLIWSVQCQLRRKLDLVLIQREAYRRAIQLAFVCQDARLAADAAELNISCFSSVEQAERQRWKRGRHKVFLPRYHKPSARSLAEDLAYMRSRRRQRPGWRAFIERLIALALLTLAVGGAIYAVAPGATVTVAVKRDDISVVFDALADHKAKALDADAGIIPAESIRATVETASSIPTSGRVSLDGPSAAVAVAFSNLGDASVLVPRGTILGSSADSPILFKTLADALVPAGFNQQVDAAAAAMASNRDGGGGLSASKIDTIFGGLEGRVSVRGNSAAGGGGEIPAVAQVDQDTLLEIARIQLQSLAYEAMRADLVESQIIIIESLRIVEERKDWTEFSAAVGTMTSELSLSMRAVVSALAIDERQSRQLLEARLQAAAPANSDLRAESVTYTRGPFAAGKDEGQASFTISGSGSVSARLDSNQLRQRLAGLSLDDALEYLAGVPELSAAMPPAIQVYPSSLGRLPLLALRIDLQLADEA